MTTAASLPLTRPSSDTYGPDLVNDRPVTRRDRELDAGNWNRLKADAAAACQVAALAIIRVANAGSASLTQQRPATLGAVSVARISTGHVEVTLPAGVVALDAHACSIGVAGLGVSCTISGQIVSVYTMNSGGAADAPFSLWVY